MNRVLTALIWLALVLFPVLGVAQEPLFPRPPSDFDATIRAEASDEISDRFLIEFPSAVKSPFVINNTVYARYRVPKEAPHPMPVVLMLHPWGVTSLNFEERIAKALNAKGIAALIITLPYHLERVPEGYGAGQLMIRPDAEQLRNNMRQSIADIQRLIDWASMRSELDTERLGIEGISLGALISALYISVDERWKAAALVVGGADFAHVLWHSTLTVETRIALRSKGYDEDKLRAELKEVEPLTYLREELRDRVLLIGGRYDNVVPVVDFEKLRNALGKPPTIRLDTGHFGPALISDTLSETLSAYFDARLRDQPFKAPRYVYSPTIRLGAMASDWRDLRVTISADLFRLGANGDGFVSVYLNARGLGLFAGLQTPFGISPGVTIAPERTAFGIFWHTVL